MTASQSAMRQLLDSTYLRIFISACVMLLLHLPFVLLTINTERNHHEKPGIHLPAVVSLQPATSFNLSVFERDLYAWIEIADPRRMLHPDLQHGFSSFSNPALVHATPALPIWSLQAYFWPRQKYPESKLAVQSKTLAELIHEQWNRKSALFLLPFERIDLPSGVFWRFSDSTRQIHALAMPEEFFTLSAIPDETNKITGLTTLEVNLLPELPYPRIILRESCGNPRFDQLAVRAVKNHFIEHQRRSGMSSAITSLKGKGSWLLTADWRLSQLGGEP